MKTMDYSKASINVRGNRVNVDSTKDVTAQDVRNVGGIKEGRDVTAITPSGNYMLESNKRYDVPNRTKFVDTPGIRKASGYSSSDYTYKEYRRDDALNRVILDQIEDLERNMFKTDLEVDDLNLPTFIRIPNFKLPKETRKLNPGVYTVSVIIALPDQFPYLPPVGFYLPKEIRAGEHANFSQGFHGAFGSKSHESDLMSDLNYSWYCSSIIASTWEPARLRYISDWRKGDNLWHVVSLISEVLSDFSDD